MPTETTLVLLKPDAVRRGLVAELIGRFERRGFRIRGLKQLVLQRSVERDLVFAQAFLRPQRRHIGSDRERHRVLASTV